jgi:hypothetical protein
MLLDAGMANAMSLHPHNANLTYYLYYNKITLLTIKNITYSLLSLYK